jgi:hypothetical protein
VVGKVQGWGWLAGRRCWGGSRRSSRLLPGTCLLLILLKQFDDGEWAGVPDSAFVQLDDAGVTPRTLGIARADLPEQFLEDVIEAVPFGVERVFER